MPPKADQSVRPVPRSSRAVLRSLRLFALAIVAAVLLPFAWTGAASGDGVSILLSVSDVPAPSTSGSSTVAPTSDPTQPSVDPTQPSVDPTGEPTVIDPSGTGTGTSNPGAVPTTGSNGGSGGSDGGSNGGSTGGDGGLAWTGSTAVQLILPALLLLLAGVGAIAFARRRRTGRHTV